jgi:predicted phage terminase large subunit-like protein
MDRIEIRPQLGPQTDFASTAASIAIYGGSAGGGKSFALLLEPLYHFNNPKFGAVIFRRNMVQIRNEGGLWDEAESIYRQLGAHMNQGICLATFPSGARVKFSHLEHDHTVYTYQGSQIAMIGFDELTHFSENSFWYMLSRNRSVSGVPGYIRATCNPDVDSWVRKLIDWYIDEHGYPIKEHSGKIRWFIRQNDELIWANTCKELIDLYGSDQIPKSFTFIPSSVYDNKILMEKDPSYLSNLMALPRVERLRLLGGNWNVRYSGGDYFQREWFEIIDVTNTGSTGKVRYWDRASTKPNESNPDPDWTRGLKLNRLSTGAFVVEDVRSLRDSPLAVERLIKNTATQDGCEITVCVEQDPGSSGVADAENYVRLLAGFYVQVRRPSNDKITRALPVSAQAQAGNVKLLRGSWNEAFLNELENFPLGGHDDQVDVLSGAFNEMCQGVSILDVL